MGQEIADNYRSKTSQQQSRSASARSVFPSGNWHATCWPRASSSRTRHDEVYRNHHGPRRLRERDGTDGAVNYRGTVTPLLASNGDAEPTAHRGWGPRLSRQRRNRQTARFGSPVNDERLTQKSAVSLGCAGVWSLGFNPRGNKSRNCGLIERQEYITEQQQDLISEHGKRSPALLKLSRAPDGCWRNNPVSRTEELSSGSTISANWSARSQSSNSTSDHLEIVFQKQGWAN